MAESIGVLDGISKILGDGAYLDAVYATYAAQCERTQTQPEPAALWISKAASAEVAKAKELLMPTHTGEAASKRRQVAAAGQDEEAALARMGERVVWRHDGTCWHR